MHTTAFYRAVALLIAAFVSVSAPDIAQAKGRKSRPSAAKVPDALRGSKEALARENMMADRFGMRRYADSRDLKAAIDRGDLVPILTIPGITLHADIGEMDLANRGLYSYVQPQVNRFLLSVMFRKGRPAGLTLKLSSFVRTRVYQELLQHRYVNAVSSRGASTASSHLTGATFDISTKEMSAAVRTWLRGVLAEFEANGLIQATEETGRFGGKRKVGSMCFHVMVSPAFHPVRVPAPR